MQIFFATGIWILSFFIVGCAVNDQQQEMQIPALPMPDSGQVSSYRPQVIANYNTQGQRKEFLFTTEPNRVICVWQNSIETLLALGKGDHIAAAFGLPDKRYLRPEYQETYERIPHRQFQLMDNEAILMMEPDFILAWNSTFGSRNYLRSTDFWNSRGIHSYIAESSGPFSPYRTIEMEYQYILDMGRIFNAEERAIQLVEQMKEEIANAKEKTRERKKERAIILEVQGRQMRVYGEKTLAGDLLTKIGGELIPMGETIGSEQLIEADPDIVFLVVSENVYNQAEQIKERLMSQPALRNLHAFQAGRVYIVPLYYVYSSATRTYDGILLFTRALYPDLYEEEFKF